MNLNIACEVCLPPFLFLWPPSLASLPYAHPLYLSLCVPPTPCSRCPVRGPPRVLPSQLSVPGQVTATLTAPPRTSYPFLRHTAIASVLSLREFYPYHLTGFLSVSLGPTWSFPLHHKSTLGLNRAFREKPLCETEAFNLCSFHKIPWSGKNPPYSHT